MPQPYFQFKRQFLYFDICRNITITKFLGLLLKRVWSGVNIFHAGEKRLSTAADDDKPLKPI